MIPKTYRQDRQVDMPLSIVRKTILAYRIKPYSAPSTLRRAELERYMRRVRIKPGPKNKAKKKLDTTRVMALADSDEEPAPPPWVMITIAAGPDA